MENGLRNDSRCRLQCSSHDVSKLIRSAPTLAAISSTELIQSMFISNRRAMTVEMSELGVG